MIAIEIDKGQIERLRDSAKKSSRAFSKEIAAAINQVSKKTKLQIGRDIRNTVNLKKDEAEKPLSITATASENSLQAVVTLKKTKRLGLRHFGARQDKTGASYKINKTGGRSRVKGAFAGPKPGVVRMKWKGNVFKRVGKSRLPIVQLKGVSAFGAYVKNDLDEPQVKMIREELTKQLERRIKLNVLRASGLVTT